MHFELSIYIFARVVLCLQLSPHGKFKANAKRSEPDHQVGGSERSSSLWIRSLDLPAFCGYLEDSQLRDFSADEW